GEGFSVLFHQVNAPGEAMVSAFQAELPVYRVACRFHEFPGLVLLYLIDDVTEHQFAVDVLVEVRVHLGCRTFVPEVLVEGGQEEIEVLSGAGGPPVTHAEIACSQPLAGIDVRGKVAESAV